MTQSSNAAERKRIAAVLEREEVVDAIAGFAADNRRTVLLIAHLLRSTDVGGGAESLADARDALHAAQPDALNPDEDVIVSWSGKRHYSLPGGRVLNDGSVRARCSDATYGKPADLNGVVRWGAKSGRAAADLPLCKSCVRAAPA